MAVVYFDASAFVKLLVREPGSEFAAALWDTSDVALSSRLAYPEVCAALAAAHRNHDLDDEAFESATHRWARFWAATRPVELTGQLERRAGALAVEHALPGADAVHLASALTIGDPSLIVAVWDGRLHAGVLAAGLGAAPVTLDPT